MPELPEVETTLQAIKPVLEGCIIKTVTIRQPKLRWPISPELPAHIAGQTVKRCWRRSKYIICEYAHGAWILHLGMSGNLTIWPQATPLRKHDHVVFHLQKHQIHFNDVRRFGSLFWQPHPVLAHKLLAQLGPEPLSDDFNVAYVLQATSKRSIAIKNWLMNAQCVVGVGNIYASEALFEAKIHPLKPASSLNAHQIERLVVAVKQVLTKAIRAGGTTLRDFYQPDKQTGYFQQALKVYGRTGCACYDCQAKIVRMVIGQRSSFYCENCQQQ